MAAFIAPALTALIGGILGHHGQTQDIEKQNALNRANEEAAQRARYDMGRNGYEAHAAGQAVRGQVARDLLSKYFSNIDPKLLAQIGTPTAYPNFEFAPGQQQAAPGWTGAAGNFLSGIAPYLGMAGAAGSQGGDPAMNGFTQASPTSFGRGSSTATAPGTQYAPGGGPIGSIAPTEVDPEAVRPRTHS